MVKVVFVFSLAFLAKDTNGESFVFSWSFLAKDTNGDSFVFSWSFLAKDTNGEIFVWSWSFLATVTNGESFFVFHGHFWPRLLLLATSAMNTNDESYVYNLRF